MIDKGLDTSFETHCKSSIKRIQSKRRRGIIRIKKLKSFLLSLLAKTLRDRVKVNTRQEFDTCLYQSRNLFLYNYARK